MAFALAFTGLAAAQETTGTISGRIVDSQGLPVPGVTVTAAGPQGSRTSVSDADGRYSIPFATPGSYDVRAELQGFKTAQQKGVNVSLGQTASVNLTMTVGGVTETVEVTAGAPVVDTTSTTTGAVLGSDELARIPIGRRVSDALYVAPGVSTGGSVGSANPSISGGSGLENQYVIDGVNVTNQGYGALGSYSIVFGSLGNATPFDFVQEVQVKTGGYEAEFGQSTGGVVNVVTKSGSNQFSGSVFGYSRPSGLEGGFKQYQSTNGSINQQDASLSDTGAEVGGPILKDKLFFFGAIDPSWDRAGFKAPPGFALEGLGTVQRKRRTVSYSAKATYQLSSANRIDASFFGDPSTGDMGPQRITSLLNTTTSGFSSIKYGGHNQTVRYNGVLGTHLLAEAYWARALNDINETPSVDTWAVTDFTVTPNIRSGGIGFYEQGNHSLNNQYVAKLTSIFGANELKYGIEYDDVTYSNLSQRTGPTFLAPDGRQTATGAQISIVPDVNYGKIYRVTRANFNAGRTTTQKYVDFFVQDSVRLGNKLTLNPGLRYEQEKLAGSIIKDFTLKNNWAPRIGATYDINGDGRSKVYGNFGIYYARVPNDLAARALSADDSTGLADYFDANLTQPVPAGVATIDPRTGKSITQHFSLLGVGADDVDPNAKLSYVREFVLGYERQVAPNTSVGLRWINRRIPRVLEDITDCPMAAYFLDATADVGCGNIYILTNPTAASPVNAAAIAAVPAFADVKFAQPVHKYDAVELTLDRRFSNRWQATASYRWSRLRGNFEGFYRDDNGQSDPGISSLYDFPTNDPTYTSIGVAQLGFEGDIRNLNDENGILPLDRPHQGKLYGSYQFDWGLNLGLGWTVQSGKPLTPLASNPAYSNSGEIPTGPRGSGIQTVDGFKTRTPVQSLTSLQAAYDLKLGGNRKISLMADVFNLFNQKTTLDYDNYTDLSFGAGPNPDFGKPISNLFGGRPPQFQTPIQLRVGARFSF
ncbi:MAG TPA: TonB-dependent receptor [Vicinamibacterales bacterium]|nr:TonB-dependent receptor [Vicinamibacterales bacterium]